MKISAIATASLSLASLAFGASAFVPPSTARRRHGAPTARLLPLRSTPDDLLKSSAEQMRNMSTADVERMLTEMESMGPAQRAALKAMGMDPDLMTKSMKMMKDNPRMMESARKMMEGMTPEQLMEQSRLAQQQMAGMEARDVEAATRAMESLSPEQLDAAADAIRTSGLPSQMKADEPAVIDAMYRMGEMMSQPPAGGVTLAAFATLPPVSTLSGTREEDLSEEELEECWNEGSKGMVRVDRAGFERVWNELREYFEGDIMDEARKTAGKGRLGGSAAAAGGAASASSSSSAPASPSPAPAPAPAARPVVGASLTPEEMAAVNARARTMTEDDIGTMLDQMNDMTPEQEARMRAMGADPAMMAKAAKMMASNPAMKKAATEMMKRMTPEQMTRASQEAQRQIENMSEADRKRAMEEMDRMKDQ